MKKIFTILSAMLFATGVFAATEQAWYNDVTSITANGQYYIYSVKGKGFVQGGQSKVKAVTTSNYNSESGLLFTITNASGGKTYNGSNYLSAYQMGTNGPTAAQNGGGTTLTWTKKSSFWWVYAAYNFIWDQKAYLMYDNGYDGKTNTTPGDSDAKFQWYLISPAQFDRHFAIYFFDAYKESLNIAQYNGLVPAAYYTALETAYNQSFSVTNAAHSAEVVNAAKANLEALYTGAADVAAAYATATAAINTLEAVEDKGEDFAEVTTDITNARAALEQALSVEAVNAAVANLKAIDPITFNVTEFEAPNFVTNAASSSAGRTITYNAADKTVINADGKAIYVGSTTLTATAAATNEYYKFVRSAQVTVSAPTTYGEFSATTCGEAVEFNEQTYEESFAGEVHLTNIYGGDSIVAVAITINYPTYGEDTKTIVYGAEESWNGIALSDSTVGEHTVLFTTENVVGCDSVVTLHLTVNKQETLNVPVELSFCEGGSVWYRGTEYTEAELVGVEAEGEIRDTMYVLNITVLHPTFGEDTKTIVYGAEESWNGIALSDSTVGEHTVLFTTENAVGCDSTVTLALTVSKQETLEVPVELVFCEGGLELYRGTEYTEAGVFEVPAIGEIRDTLYVVTVSVNSVYAFAEEDTVYINDVYQWQGEERATNVIGVFNFEAPYVTVHGCDSIYTLRLTVIDRPTTYGEYNAAFCEGDSVEFAGKWYTAATQEDVLMVEKNIFGGDSIVTLTVAVNPKDYVELNIDSLHVGELLVLGEGQWYLGEELLTEPEYLQTETGAFDIIQTLKNEFDCDSVIVRHVVVEEASNPTTGLQTVEGVQTAVKEFRNGVIYIRRGEGIYTTEGKRVK